jgi:hypothetical protein
MKLLMSLLAIAGGAFATLTMLGLLVAGMPNATPEKLTEIRGYMWVTGGVGLAGLVAGIWGVAQGKHRFAAWTGAAPIGFVILLFVALLALQR